MGKLEQCTISNVINLEELTCPICFDLFKDPVMRRDCEHIFCLECINLWLSKKECCPTCKAAVTMSETRRCRALSNFIMNLPMRCKNPECSVITTHQNIESHELCCPFSRFSCPYGCETHESMNKEDLLKHLEQCNSQPCITCGGTMKEKCVTVRTCSVTCLSSLKEKYKKASSENKTLKSEVERLSKEYMTVSSDLEDVKDMNTELCEQLNAQSFHIENLKNSIKKLKDTIMERKKKKKKNEGNTQCRVVKHVMMKKKKRPESVLNEREGEDRGLASLRSLNHQQREVRQEIGRSVEREPEMNPIDEIFYDVEQNATSESESDNDMFIRLGNSSNSMRHYDEEENNSDLEDNTSNTEPNSQGENVGLELALNMEEDENSSYSEDVSDGSLSPNSYFMSLASPYERGLQVQGSVQGRGNKRVRRAERI